MCRRKQKTKSIKWGGKEMEVYYLGNYEIPETEYVKLWQYFEDKADKLKDRAWTFAAFLLGLAGVIVGYIIDGKVIIYTKMGFNIDQPGAAIAFSILGCFLCFFGWLVAYDYGAHIQRNWQRSSTFVKLIKPLKAILDGEYDVSNDKKDTSHKEEQGQIIRCFKRKVCNMWLFRRLCLLPPVIKWIMVLFLIYFAVFIVIIIGAWKAL